MQHKFRSISTGTSKVCIGPIAIYNLYQRSYINCRRMLSLHSWPSCWSHLRRIFRVLCTPVHDAVMYAPVHGDARMCTGAQSAPTVLRNSGTGYCKIFGYRSLVEVPWYKYILRKNRLWVICTLSWLDIGSSWVGLKETNNLNYDENIRHCYQVNLFCNPKKLKSFFKIMKNNSWPFDETKKIVMQLKLWILFHTNFQLLIYNVY